MKLVKPYKDSRGTLVTTELVCRSLWSIMIFAHLNYIKQQCCDANLTLICIVFALCGLRAWHNSCTPFPGWLSCNLTKPTFSCSFGFRFVFVLASTCILCFFVSDVCMFLLSAWLQLIAGNTPLRNDLQSVCWLGHKHSPVLMKLICDELNVGCVCVCVCVFTFM